MRSLRIAIFLFLVTWGVAPVLAQYGLYGSPEALRLPQMQPVMAPGGYPTAGVYAAAPAPQSFSTAYAPPRPLGSGPYVQAVAPDASRVPGGAFPREPAEPFAPARAPSVVNQMLNQQGGGYYSESAGGGPAGCACGEGAGGCYSGGVGRFQQTAFGSECGGGCACPWYAGANALMMTRDTANRVWTTYLNNHDEIQLAHSNDVAMDWRWGGEVRLGYRFCCDLWALEATYWTLAEFSRSLTVTGRDGEGLGTPLNDQQVCFIGTDPDIYSADLWFGNGALEHRLWRRNEFHNGEINAIRNRLYGACDSSWSVGWLAGFRYFRFDESFTLASVRDGGSWSQPDTVAYLDDRVTNNLWGFQMGFNADYCLADNLRVFVTPKFGIYDNHITHYFHLHLGDGTPGNTGETLVPGTFPVNTETDAISFLTQIDVGVDWRFAAQWSARLGYRVVAATGIGLAENQFPQYLVDIPEISHIKTNGDLILHGAYAGLTYNY